MDPKRTLLVPDHSTTSSFIVPSIIHDEEDTRHLDESSEEEDQTQHYFSDQVKYHRPKWEKPWFAMVGMAAAAVDISCVSSFPSKVANNGGVAFLIAYLVAQIFLVFPYMYLEGILGQYFQISMFGIWGICPIGRGISLGAFFAAFCLATFSPSYIVWALLMMVEAMETINGGVLPWATCNNTWNTCTCKGDRLKGCPPEEMDNVTETEPAYEYFLGHVLKIYKTMGYDPKDIKNVKDNGNMNASFGFNNAAIGLGALITTNAMVLVFVYAIMLLITLSRHKFSGYIYTGTIVFPLMVLVLLLCRALTLEGCTEGLIAYLQPNFTKLTEREVWVLAGQTAFYSNTAGIGLHLTVASFNPLHHNVFGDVLGCLVIDTICSLLGCIVNYSFLGHLHLIEQHNDNKSLRAYPNDTTTTFVFIDFAETLSQVSGASFFAFLFYMMIFVFATDTAALSMQAITYGLYEEYRRKYPEQHVERSVFVAIALGVGFVAALLTVTRGGYWIVEYVDAFIYKFSFNVYPVLQSLVISWFWGIENICHAVETIYGKRPSFFMRFCWKFTCPAIFCWFIAGMIEETTFEPLTLLSVTAPKHTVYLGIFLSFVGVGLCAMSSVFNIIRACAKNFSLKLLVLLISPEYEHDEIKANIWAAKRLHLKHYLFFAFPDEIEKNPFLRIFCRPCGKNRVDSEEHAKKPHKDHHIQPERKSETVKIERKLSELTLGSSSSATTLSRSSMTSISTAASALLDTQETETVISENISSVNTIDVEAEKEAGKKPVKKIRK